MVEMMRRHLVIEGCDGSGKDSLINRIQADPQFSHLVMHPRASTSLGGPVANLDVWVSEDLAHIETVRPKSPAYIYNRHPLISEFIYAPFRQLNPGLSGAFKDQTWVDFQQLRLAAQSVLVITQPPFAEVDRIMIGQGRDAHMPGVTENRFSIYSKYAALVWPGSMIRYNRTRSNYEDLAYTIGLALGLKGPS